MVLGPVQETELSFSPGWPGGDIGLAQAWLWVLSSLAGAVSVWNILAQNIQNLLQKQQDWGKLSSNNHKKTIFMSLKRSSFRQPIKIMCFGGQAGGKQKALTILAPSKFQKLAEWFEKTSFP